MANAEAMTATLAVVARCSRLALKMFSADSEGLFESNESLHHRGPRPALMTIEQQFGLMGHHSRQLGVLNMIAAMNVSDSARFGLRASLSSSTTTGGVLLTFSEFHNTAAC